MNIIPRSDWRARAPKRTSPLPRDDNGWVLHWNGPPVNQTIPTSAYLRGVQDYHMDTKGWSDFAYNFAIDQAGFVWEGRGFDRSGAATSGKASDGYLWNTSSRSVLFCIGEGQRPSASALVSADDLIDMYPGPVHAHKDASTTGTACPGPELTSFARNYQPTKETPMTTSATRQKVAALYKTILGVDTPDAAGHNFWVEEITSGRRTLSQVERAMVIIAIKDLREIRTEVAMLRARVIGLEGEILPQQTVSDVLVDAVLDEFLNRLGR